MKKTMIFISILILTIIAFSANKVIGVTTTTTLADTNIFDEGGYYYYSDYQELISQVYEDVYDQIYQEIYSEIMDDINEEFYEQIYSQVEENLADLLTSEQLKLYIADFEDQIHSVVYIAERSVFGVSAYTPSDGTAIGSGVVYRYDELADVYYLITNYHVIRNYVEYQSSSAIDKNEISLDLVFADGTSVELDILGYDTEVDLAVLTFSGVGLDDIIVSEFEDEANVEASDFVFAVGNPIGYNFYNSITMGIISGIDRKVDIDRYVDYIQHDAAINGGNSGGPIYNIYGKVVGINVSKLADIEIEGMGFAINLDFIQRVISRIEADNMPVNTIMPRIGANYYIIADKIDGTTVELPSLTVGGQIYTELVLDLPTGVYDGLLINKIISDQTLAGILGVGDIIVAIDTYNIHDKESFLEYLYTHYEAGDMITIHYYDFDETTFQYENTISSITIELK